MAIQRTKPGQSFLNRPIGVVSQRTGAEKVYEARAKETEQLGKVAFEYAVSEQKKEGQEYAFSNQLRVRDENGEVSFKQMPASLGRYGQAEAEKIFAERFLAAAKVDASQVLNKLHAANKGKPAEFERAATEYLKQTALKMEDDGAGRLAQIFFDNTYAEAMEHTNKLALEQFELQEAEAKANDEIVFGQDIAQMRAFNAAGNYDQAAAILDDAHTTIKQRLQNGSISGNEFINKRNDLGDNYLFSKFMGAAKGRKSNDLEALLLLVSQGNLNEIDRVLPGMADDFRKYAPTQDRLDKFETDVTNVITRLRNVEKARLDFQSGASFLSERQAIDPFEEKNKKQSEVYFSTTYKRSGIDFADPAFLQSNQGARFLQDMSDTQVIPKSLAYVFDDLVTGASNIDYSKEQYSALLSIARSSMPEGSYATKGLSEKTRFALVTLEHLDKYSPANFEQNLNVVRLIAENNPETLARINANIDDDYEGTSVYNAAEKFIKNEINPQPEHLKDLTSVAASLLLSQPNEAKEIIETYYDQYFIKSNFLRPVAGEPGRSMQAPEAFFDAEGLKAFEAFVQNKLLTTDALTFDDKGRPVVPAFKKDIFLEVDIGSTDKTQYFLVDRDGNRVRNPQTGYVVTLGPQQISAYYKKVSTIDNAEIMTIRDQRIQKEQNKRAAEPFASMLYSIAQEADQ